MAIIWNPTVRKSVGIVVIPKAGYECTIVGFGVCRDTGDPKLVKIYVDKKMWVVEVFTFSTRVWRTVYTGAPFNSCDMECLRNQVFVDGVIYFYVDPFLLGARIISFDLKSEKFGEVNLPASLVRTLHREVMKVNESLGLLEYYDEGKMSVCGVWSRKDGANNPFTKIYTIKVEGKGLYNWVLAFRNNGEVVIKVDDGKYKESRIGVYEPLSGHINDVGINGKRLHGYFCVRSYMETLLLLDESDSIIY